MFKNALVHVQRNYKALLIYIAISASYFAARVAVEHFMLGKIERDSISTNQVTYLLVAGILTAVVIAMAQTLAFTRLARDIDRPFWKIEPGFRTFFRYCSFWFTLNYINIAALLFIGIAPFENDAKVSMSLFRVLYEVMFIPFGATVMFYGNTSRQEIVQALSTMLLQLPRFLLTEFFGLCFIGILDALQTSLPMASLPALAVIDAYFSCFIFAYVWEICRFNREEEENSDDMEF